jgi:hypothetical protein
MFSTYNQPYQNQGYQQPQQSSFGGIFGSGSIFGGSEKLTPQTIEQIVLQLQQQGIPQNSIMDLEEVLNEMVQKGTEKISNVLKQFISPELSQQVLSSIELEELEDDISGTSNRGYPSASRGYPSASRGYPSANRGYPSASPGYPSANRGYPRAPIYGNHARGEYEDNYDYEGGKKRRTRRRRRSQRGGFNDNTSSYGSNAAPFQGGRRRRKSHKKHNKSCKH